MKSNWSENDPVKVVVRDGVWSTTKTPVILRTQPKFMKATKTAQQTAISPP